MWPYTYVHIWPYMWPDLMPLHMPRSRMKVVSMPPSKIESSMTLPWPSHGPFNHLYLPLT